MKTKLSLLIYLKKPKNYKSGPAPICLGITAEGKDRRLPQEENVIRVSGIRQKGRIVGTKEAIKSINAYLGSLEQQLLDTHAILNREADQRLPGYF